MHSVKNSAPPRPPSLPPASAEQPAARPTAVKRVKLAIKEILSSPALKPFWLASGYPVYLLLRLLEPWRRIEVDMLEFERIGHCIADTEQYLRDLVNDPGRAGRQPVFVAGPPANRQILEMIKRKAPVLESSAARLFYMLALKPWIAGGRFDARLVESFQSERTDFFRSFASAPPQLSFLASEKRRGKALLRQIGVPEGKDYFCFHARDGAYLAQVHSQYSRQHWSYHDFRDGAVESCLPAAEALAREGLAALRMGYVVDRPISAPHPLVIDYACRHRCDFGDAFLIAHAKFFLGNTSGISAVAHSFNVPMAMANLAPIGAWPPWLKSDLFITKKFWSRKERRLLTFREIFALGADRWHSSGKFDAAGIDVIENTAEEILALALEMNARLDGTWMAHRQDERLQERFRALVPDGRLLKRFPSRLGAQFLRLNQQLLD